MWLHIPAPYALLQASRSPEWLGNRCWQDRSRTNDQRLWNREDHELLVDLIIHPFKKARSCSLWNIHHLPLKGSGSVLSPKQNHSRTRRDPKPQIEMSASAFSAIWQRQQQLMHMASLSDYRGFTAAYWRSDTVETEQNWNMSQICYGFSRRADRNLS